MAYRIGDWVVQKWLSSVGEAENLAASQLKAPNVWTRRTSDVFSIQGLEA